jgi:hypothetical protein
VTFDQRAAAARADSPPDERAGEIAERSDGREDKKALDPRCELHAEQRRVLAGDRARAERPGVEHHQLAADRKQGIECHQAEHDVGAVVGYPTGDLARHAGGYHERRLLPRTP